MSTENSPKRAAAFYLLLGVPILAWAALVLPYYASVYLPNQFPNAFTASSAVLRAAVSALAFKKVPPEVPKRINAAKSAYWEDLERIYKEKDCTAARMLLTDLQKAMAMETERNLFLLRYPTKPHALEYAKQHVDSKCPQAEVERP